jgi:hypothetical protein
MSMHRSNSVAGIDRLHLSLDDLPTVTLEGTEDPAPVAPARARNGGIKTSLYRGVARLRGARSRPWVAMIARERGQQSATLGYFATEEEAARAYDREVLRLGKPAEWLNFPGEAKAPDPGPGPTSSLGREIEAMRAVAAALAGLDGAACRRVLEYVGRHLSGVEEG